MLSYASGLFGLVMLLLLALDAGAKWFSSQINSAFGTTTFTENATRGGIIDPNLYWVVVLLAAGSLLIALFGNTSSNRPRY